MKYVMAFDIVNDRVRYRAVKILLEYGYRVQKSVFEGYLSKQSLEECAARLKKTINLEEDSVRFYPLCKDCEPKVAVMGIGTTIEQTEYIVL